ncbi:hypothetical protein SAMN04487957_10329 [Halomonas shengliensis]|uniref:ABC-type transport auxiliary lipoprotein component domain-containing protein n=1 Tax=Halomonas shengliensis TaxID=419597 RepID=A0A1H0G1N4_9GAMM|nr:ABC-type transport auxiliary lipoprotein family protein [Halomonas shengliensis]SDO00795.1 hypothetical protein SAMN04487957_10329 [Halomonas shengliensis]
MTARRWLFPLLMALPLAALTGCASNTPAPERYTLPAVEVAAAGGAEAAHELRLAPPRLAHYLDVEGIVMQVDDITLVEAKGYQWAEALSAQLQRGLRDRLAARLPDTRVVLERPGQAEGDSLRLALEIDRFQGRHDGLAVIGGRWRLEDADGSLLAMEGLAAEVALAADGYPALVRALGQGWDRVADELAAAIRRSRRQQ